LGHKASDSDERYKVHDGIERERVEAHGCHVGWASIKQNDLTH
jgi:hypothetical protein